MKHPRIVAGAAAAAVFLVGIGVGAASSNAPAATPEPEIVTKTQTVTETVEVAPQSCLDALDTAEDLFVLAADGVSAIAPVFQLVGRAANAGATLNGTALAQITNRVEQITAEIQAQTAQVDQTGATFRDEASECRSATAQASS